MADIIGTKLRWWNGAPILNCLFPVTILNEILNLGTERLGGFEFVRGRTFSSHRGRSHLIWTDGPFVTRPAAFLQSLTPNLSYVPSIRDGVCAEAHRFTIGLASWGDTSRPPG